MPTVVFVHGAWCTGAFFQYLWVKIFESAGFTCVVITLPGHSPEGDPSGKNLDDYVKHVLSELAKIDGEIILVGHSLGGRIVQMAADNNPRIKLLYLVGSVPPPGILYRGKLWWRVRRYRKAVLSGNAFEIVERDALDLLFNRTERPYLWLKYLVKESGLVVRELVLTQFYFWRKPPHITGTIIVVAGTDDAIMPFGLQKEIRDAYRCRMMTIQDGGHFPMVEACAEAVGKKMVNTARALFAPDNQPAPVLEAA